MLHNARKPVWSYLLLNEDDEPVDTIQGVTGGSVEIVSRSRLGGSGNLAIDKTEQEIDWLKARVQIRYDPGVEGYESWAVATMLGVFPSDAYDEFGVTYEVALLTKMSIIDEDSVSARYGVEKGVNIVSEVVDLIRSCGEERISVTDSDAVVANPLTWDAGESKLTIINDLLEAAGYWSLWCDGDGQFRVEPYVDPKDRPIAYEFITGDQAIHSAVWDRDQDISNVPNRFIVTGEGDDEEPGLVGVATNENPESRWSYQERGRWITSVEDGFEGETQASFNDRAQLKLLGAMSPVAHISVEHEVMPLEPNDLIMFQPGDQAVVATVQRMSYGFSLEASCEAEWREVMEI